MPSGLNSMNRVRAAGKLKDCFGEVGKPEQKCQAGQSGKRKRPGRVRAAVNPLRTRSGPLLCPLEVVGRYSAGFIAASLGISDAASLPRRIDCWLVG